MSDTCVGVSWETEGAHATRATVSPVEEFPLSHPASMDPKTKTCLGLGAVADAEAIALPASGRTWDPETGACSAATLTGGELLFNPGARPGRPSPTWAKAARAAWWWRGTRRRVVPGARQRRARRRERGPRRGGDCGTRPGGRFVSAEQRGEHRSRGPAHPKTPAAVSTAGACALDSASVEDASRSTASTAAALRWAWNARAPEGAVLGPFPGTGSLRPAPMGAGPRRGPRRLARTTTPPAPWPDGRHGGGHRAGLGRAACARAPARTTAPTAPRAARAREGRTTRARGARPRSGAWPARRRAPARDAGRRRGVPGGVRRRRLVRGVRA